MKDQLKVAGSLAVEQRQPQVIVIEAAEQPEAVKLRVAAYCRVSSDSEDQRNSFGAQTRYFTQLITGKENWTLADIYADEGITGTSAAKREDFQRLMNDCRRGRIDKVLVKSISRFARNTKECLEAIRELKNLGISVYFEDQNIDTGSMTGELMTSIYASIAQAESESISRNTRPGFQYRMKSGTYIPSALPYGYCHSGREIIINNEEAEVVRLIFASYLAGEGMDRIAAALTRDGVRHRSGSTIWKHKAISDILTNEKYTGNSIWQKYYSTDTLPVRYLPNRGQRIKYYVENTHPPIISQEEYDAAQRLIKSRREKYTKEIASQRHPLQLKLRCQCGNLVRRKVIRNKAYWVCMEHEKQQASCPIPQILEEEIYAAFLRLFYKLRHQGLAILRDMVSSFREVKKRRLLWREDIVELNKRISEIADQDRLLNELNSSGLVDPDFFIRRSNELATLMRTAKVEKERLLNELDDNSLLLSCDLLEVLEDAPEFLEEFDPAWFDELVQGITVESETRLRFRLVNGLELTEHIERRVR